MSYYDMKQQMMNSGTLVFDKILADDEERSVCIYEYKGKKYVLKLGNHAERDDTTKFKLLQHEDKIYMKLQTLIPEKRKYFPNVYDAGSVDDTFYYIIMEYIEGETLYNYINSTYNKSYKPKNEVLTILLNLTKALNAMYSLGIIHGDLSVENVMIKPDLNVKLIDFEKSSSDIKLETNTHGTTGTNINSSVTEGVGYYFLLVKTLSIAVDGTKLYPLLEKIKTKINACNKYICKNFYDDCEKIIGELLKMGGKRKSFRKALRKRRKTARR